MLLSTLAFSGFAAMAAAQTGVFPSAPVQSGNPLGASYVAVLPNKPSTNVRGSIVASTAPGGVGVSFAVSLSGLPSSGGPFIYHIHEKPVPADGNCTATLAHLDPLKRGEDPPCDASAPATCQVGDLAGKHGKVPGPTFSAYYSDAYVSAQPGNAAYFGDKSIVVHYANKTRITCANFVPYTPGYNATGVPLPSGSPTGTGSGGSPSSSVTYTVPPPTGTGTATGTGPIATGAAAATNVRSVAAAAAVGLAGLFAIAV